MFVLRSNVMAATQCPGRRDPRQSDCFMAVISTKLLPLDRDIAAELVAPRRPHAAACDAITHALRRAPGRVSWGGRMRAGLPVHLHATLPVGRLPV